MKPKHEYINPRVGNEFMALDHEKKRDCYVNPCLTQLTNEL